LAPKFINVFNFEQYPIDQIHSWCYNTNIVNNRKLEMKSILAIILLTLTGCSTYPSFRYNDGYRPEDPCIRCGEKWDQLPNPEFDAQRKRDAGVRW
jgi:hypothetical protein